MSEEKRIYLGMPGRPGGQSNNAGRAFWRACRDMSPERIVNASQPGSLLASNFNVLWCDVLTRVHRGEKIDYFAMIHDDIGAEDYWLDKLIEELEAKQLDLLGVAVPIKDGRGLTSLALHNGPVSFGDENFYLWLESCDIDHSSLSSDAIAKLAKAWTALQQREYDWRVFCRLSMHDIFELPETFDSSDIGRPLLLNTGLWVCKWNQSWATQVHFEINDRIAFDESKDCFHAQCEPEDWYFSRQCHELGLKIGATRKVAVLHRGEIDYCNSVPWGRSKWDNEYVDRSPISDAFPHDILGWLRPEEGQALAELARGKRVLEIGSYRGLSTVCMARTAEHVTAVDYFDGRGTPCPGDTLPAFREAMKRHGVAHKVTTCHPEMDLPFEKYDFALIDGAHDEPSVRADMRKVLEVLSEDGLIAFHDYHSPQDPGVTVVVDELIAQGGEIISIHKTLAVVRPPACIPLEV
jgi:hypothetical protein